MARKKKSEVTTERLQELEDIKTVMQTPAGFRFVKRLISITGPYQMRFNANHAIHSFLDGERNVGCRLVADLVESCPDQYVRLLMESNLSKQIKENTDEIHKSGVGEDDAFITD